MLSKSWLKFALALLVCLVRPSEAFSSFGVFSLPPPGNSVVSSSSGAFDISSGSATDVTNLSAAIKVSGRPVFVTLIPDGSQLGTALKYPAGQVLTLDFLRGATLIAEPNFAVNNSSNWFIIDTPAAGSYTYKVQAKVSGGTGSVNFMKLFLMEL